MAALVEFHDEANLPRVLASGADLVGINNRDLRRFVTDLDQTLRLRDRIPPDVVLVSESGIRTRRDVERLEAAGVSAILVGETLMRADDIGLAVERLLGLAPEAEPATAGRLAGSRRHRPVSDRSDCVATAASTRCVLGRATGGAGAWPSATPGAWRLAARRRAAGDQHQVPDVDEQAHRLADDDDRVAAVDRVGQQGQAAEQAQPPEGDRAPPSRASSPRRSTAPGTAR